MKVISIILIITVFLFNQKETIISGKFVDSDNNPIPGVTVYLLGSDKKTNSDMNGNFEFHTDDKKNYLKISALHLERYVKYEIDETYKIFELYDIKDQKKNERRSKKVLKEWLNSKQ